MSEEKIRLSDKELREQVRGCIGRGCVSPVETLRVMNVLLERFDERADDYASLEKGYSEIEDANSDLRDKLAEAQDEQSSRSYDAGYEAGYDDGYKGGMRDAQEED